MKPRFRKNRLWGKALCLFLVVAFVSMTCSCSHTAKKAGGQQNLRGSDISAGEPKAARANSGGDPWWKKPEYEWLIATLIVIGVGIAAGAAIMISSGAGGLSVAVQK